MRGVPREPRDGAPGHQEPGRRRLPHPQGRARHVHETPLLAAGERGFRSFSEDMRDLSLRPGSVLLGPGVDPADNTEPGRLALEPSDTGKVRACQPFT